MDYYLQLADIGIRVFSPFPLLENESTKEFFIVPTSYFFCDLSITYQPIDKLPNYGEILYSEGRRLYTTDQQCDATYFSAKPGNAPYACVLRDTLRDGKLPVFYLPGSEYLINYKRNVLTLMDLEATLLHFQALIFHASLIRWHESTILFSAPSGTGKSTQAELWKKFAGAEILNGDRAALRQKNGVWHGYGLPYAGTSGIYRNEHAAVRTIVALRQASENSIRKLNASEAFRYLYPETMIHRWDPVFEERATSLLLNILNEIPVYLLSCRPDREAVELLKSELDRTNF